MKKIIIIFILLFTAVLLLSQPIIKFETLVYDYGRIKEEAGPHEVDFQFVNTGDEPFRILEVNAGWGCTAPSWSTDEIEPGETGIIYVQFDSNNRPGGFSKSIKVFTSIDDKIIRLITKGFVIGTRGKLRKKIGPIDANNDQINFGSMFLGSSQTKRIKIHNTQEDTMYISSVKDLDGIEIEIEPAILYPADYGEIIVHFNSENKNFGKISDDILLNIKFADKQHLGKLIFNANIIEDFSALSPEEKANPPIISVDNKTLFLIDLNPQELRTEVIEIENKGTRDLYIRNIQTIDDRFLIAPSKFVVGPGKKKSFNITVTPDYGVNRLKSIITIISNDPEHSILGFTIIAGVNQPKGDPSNNLIIEINIEKAKSLIQDPKGKNELVILDIRTGEEYNNGCIEDAVNINFYDPNFKKMIKLLDKHKIYLVYCQSGIRSKKAIELMSGMGFRNIYHMNEGIEGWKAQRLKLVDPNK